MGTDGKAVHHRGALPRRQRAHRARRTAIAAARDRRGSRPGRAVDAPCDRHADLRRHQRNSSLADRRACARHAEIARMTAIAYGPLIDAGKLGCRRLQLIDPQPGHVTAEVEDDYHRFFVELSHDGERITGVATNAKRFPWTTCPSAGAHLAERLTGAPLSEVASRENPLTHCTHMLDLAILAAAHAQDGAPTLYEMLVDDPHEGPREAILRSNGAETLRWLI